MRLNCFARKLENTCFLVPLLLSIAALVSCRPSLAVAIAVTKSQLSHRCHQINVMDA